MTDIEKKILANFRIKESKWKEFKILTEKNHSDSSKEIRKFIDKYILEDKKKNKK